MTTGSLCLPGGAVPPYVENYQRFDVHHQRRPGLDLMVAQHHAITVCVLSTCDCIARCALTLPGKLLAAVCLLKESPAVDGDEAQIKMLHITATTPSCLSDDDNPRADAGRASLSADERELRSTSLTLFHHCRGDSICGASKMILPVSEAVSWLMEP